jgi:hypothetical protein
MDVCELERSDSAVVSSGLCCKMMFLIKGASGLLLRGLFMKIPTTEGFRSRRLYELGDLQGRKICWVVTDALAHEDPSSPRRIAIHIAPNLKHVHTLTTPNVVSRKSLSGCAWIEGLGCDEPPHRIPLLLLERRTLLLVLSTPGDLSSCRDLLFCCTYCFGRAMSGHVECIH